MVLHGSDLAMVAAIPDWIDHIIWIHHMDCYWLAVPILLPKKEIRW